MTKNNDDKILELRKNIKEKKEELKKNKKSFTPKTNCSLSFSTSNDRININTLTEYRLKELLIHLNAWRISAEDLKIEHNLSGFLLEDWIHDVKQKLDFIILKEKEKELKQLEKKLESLLSNNKKVELEIDAIAKLLK